MSAEIEHLRKSPAVNLFTRGLDIDLVGEVAVSFGSFDNREYCRAAKVVQLD